MDVVSGESHLASTEKYGSDCARPNFTAPLTTENVAELKCGRLGIGRTEVRSVHSDSRSGHVFSDANQRERFASPL